MTNKSHEASIENRLTSMLKESKKWKPRSEQEKEAKVCVVETIKYALTGKLPQDKIKKAKSVHD